MPWFSSPPEKQLWKGGAPTPSEPTCGGHAQGQGGSVTSNVSRAVLRAGAQRPGRNSSAFPPQRAGEPGVVPPQPRAARTGPSGGRGGGGGPADLALSPAQAEARPTGGTGAPAARGSICKGGWLLPSVSSRPTQTPAAGMLAWKRSLGPLGPVLTGFGDGQGGSYALGKRI